jgi:hypothetical protein
MKIIFFSLLSVVIILGCDENPIRKEKIESLETKAGIENTYFVSPSGDDLNPCTKEMPCRNIQSVSSRMIGGDTLYVRGGSYQENEIWLRFDHQTSADKYLTIMAYMNEIPVYSNGDRPFIVEMPYVEIRGLHFTNGKSINAVKGCDGVKIIGNRFSGSGYGWAAISVEGSDVVMQGNRIELNGNIVGTQGHGIYAAQGKNIRISANFVSGTSGYGIHIFDQRRSGDTEPRVIENVLIEYNTCLNSLDRAGIIVAAQSLDATARNVKIHRNIVYGHAGNGITVIDQVSDVDVFNNTVYNVNVNGIHADGEDGIYIGRGVQWVRIMNNIVWMNRQTGHHVAMENAIDVLLSNNLYWPAPARLLNLTDLKSIISDPIFVDTGANDFNLVDGSPAIDAGIDVGLPQFGDAIDLGALEHKPSGTGVR